MKKSRESSPSKLNNSLKKFGNQNSKLTLDTNSNKRGGSKQPSTQDSPSGGALGQNTADDIDLSENTLMIGLEEAMQATLDANGEFVKTNLIRDVVFEMLVDFKKSLATFQKDMKNQGYIIRDHTNRLKTIDTDMKGINQKLGEIGEIRSQIGMINKTVSKIDKNQRQAIDEKEMMNMRTEAKLKEISDLRNQLELFRKDRKEVEKKHIRLIDNNYDDLSVQISKVDEKYAFQSKETGNKLRNFTNKLTTIDNSYKETKQHIQSTLINLINDMERYHTQEREANDKTERALKSLLSLKEKFKNYTAIIDQCKARIECTDQIQLFVERSLPILIHLQLCESLKQIISHDKFDKLHKFENAKIEEFYTFVNLYKGFRPEIGILNNRIQALTEHYYKEKKGVAEFKWGVDYEPSMIPEQAFMIDQKTFENRDKLALYVEKDKNFLEQVKKHIEDSYKLEEKTIEIAKHHLKQLLPQIKDYQIPVLHSWILRKKMLNDDFDSIVLAFSKGEDDDELVDFDPQMMMGGGFDQTNNNSVMSPVSEQQAPDSKENSIKSRLNSTKSMIPSSAPPAPAKKMTKKEFQAHQMMQMMQQANHIAKIYEEGPKHNVYVFKSQKVALKCSRDDHKFRIKERKGKRVIRNLYRKVQAIENAMPEEFKKIHELESQGKTVDYRKLIEEQEERESQEAIQMIMENATRVSKLNNIENNIEDLRPEAQPSVQSDVFEKNKNDPEYRKSVLASAKKKVMRAMLKVKMTFAIAKEKQVRLKQLKDSRPQYAIDLENFKQEQVKEIQKIVDDSVDWVMMYIKQNLEVKVEQINERLTAKTNDIEDYSLRNVGVLKQQQEANFTKVNEVYEQCQEFEKQMKEIHEAFRRDNQALIKFKQRLCSDIEVANNKIMQDLNLILEKMQGFAIQSNKNRLLINSILQSSMIDQLIMEQDQEDRKNLNLFGHETNQNILGANQGALNNYKVPGKIQKAQMQGEDPDNQDESKTVMDTAQKSFGDKTQKDTHNPIKLNSDFLLQEGSFQANNLLKQIKLACLSYQASPIEYRNIKLSQKELLETREKLLMQCQQQLQSMNPVDTSKISISTKINIPRNEIRSLNSPKIESQEVSMDELKIIATPKEVQVKNSTKDLYEEVDGKKMESKDLNRKLDTTTQNSAEKKRETVKTLSRKKEVKRAQSTLAGKKWSNKFNIESLIQKTTQIQQENEKLEASFGKSMDIQKLFSGAKNLEPSKTESKNFKQLNINNIQRKNVHLALKSNAYHQLADMANQDMMQQFVDHDLKQVQQEIQQAQPNYQIQNNPAIVPHQTFNDLVSIGKFKQNESKYKLKQDLSKNRIDTIHTEKNITFSDGNFFDSPTRGYSGINSGADLKSVYKTVIPSSHLDKNPNVTTGSLNAFHPEITPPDYDHKSQFGQKSNERSQSSFGNRSNMKLRISKRSKTPSQNTNTRNKVVGFTTYNNIKRHITGKPDPNGVPSVLGSQAIIQTVASSGSNAVILQQRQRNQQMYKLKQIDEHRRSKSTVQGGKGTDEQSEFTGRSLQEGSVFRNVNNVPTDRQQDRQYQSVVEKRNQPSQESMIGNYQHRKASMDFDQVKYKNETQQSHQPEGQSKGKVQTFANSPQGNNSQQNSNYVSVIEKPSNPREISIKTKKVKGVDVSNSYGEPQSDQMSNTNAIQTQSSQQKMQHPSQVHNSKASFAAKKEPQQPIPDAQKEAQPQTIKEKLKLDLNLNLKPETRRLVSTIVPKEKQPEHITESSLDEDSKVELIITRNSYKGGKLSPNRTLDQIDTKNHSIKSDRNEDVAKKDVVEELMNVIEPKLVIKDKKGKK